jgi:hypothetical protein
MLMQQIFNGLFVLAFLIAAIVHFVRGDFWEGMAFLGLAELASIYAVLFRMENRGC